MKVGITNSNNKKSRLYIKRYYLIDWSVEKIQKVLRSKHGRIMLFSKCAVCNSKKLKFLKEQEARGFLSSCKLRTFFSQILFIL